MKAISNTSTYEFYKKDYVETQPGIIETLISIIKNTKESPVDMREMAFNILSNLSKEFRPN